MANGARALRDLRRASPFGRNCETAPRRHIFDNSDESRPSANGPNVGIDRVDTNDRYRGVSSLSASGRRFADRE